MSKVTVEQIRRRYVVFKDKITVPEEKVQAEIDSCYKLAGLDGLIGDALELGVIHLTCHFLLLDIGPVKDDESEEKTTKRFGSDPAKMELSHYNNLVYKHSKSNVGSYLIRS